MPPSDLPVILITGGSGNLGQSIARALENDYRIVSLDKTPDTSANFASIEADLSSDEALAQTMERVRGEFGTRLAAVIHLVAYFDSTGEDNPLYQSVNVQGTRRLLRELGHFQVERFIFASTMLVHAPCRPGEYIDEDQPFEPLYVYPESKLQAENVIRDEHGAMPYAILRFAGVYDEAGVVPTLAQQIARIYERNFQSYFYSASTLVGQSMLHRADMVDAVKRVVDRRTELPPATEILIGEPEAMGYDALQDELGYLIHGQAQWPTLRLPQAMAATGAWMQEKLEPVVPDALDQGEKPFIRPYMVAMSDAHYALDTRRAEALLGWRPHHRLKDALPAIVEGLKQDPVAWYEAHGMTPPQTIRDAAQKVDDSEELRLQSELAYRQEHGNHRWAHFVNMALGIWLLTQAYTVGVEESLLRWTEMGLGAALAVFAALALSWQINLARWVCAGIGVLIMAAPFVFWTSSPAAYLLDTLIGGMAAALAVATKPEPGVHPLARTTGPEVPPGWTYNPSAWTQRASIIALALLGLLISRYLAAYQMDHIGHVWEPFFEGDPADPRNGTEEIITSSVSQAWPVPDAALGAYTYMLEILTGLIGSRARWRTMPWLVLLFGLLIVPLGIVSIGFIIIQPIVLGTWSTLALIGAAAMLLQIPYSLDELVAVFQFLRRRTRAGKSLLRVFLFGDTDEGKSVIGADEFDRRPAAVLADVIKGGVSLPWNFLVAAAIGGLLMFTRMLLDTPSDLANADHLIGALVLTIVSIAAAEVARPVRYLLIPLGLVLLVTPLLHDANGIQIVVRVLSGLALIALSFRRGALAGRYGNWRPR